VDTRVVPRALRSLTLAALILPGVALAHVAADAADGSRAGFSLLVAGLIGASALLYARGVRALWRKAGAGHGITPIQVARFASGWAVLALALLSPLDAWAAHSFAAHMLQHELLMVVAAPLFVLARPLEAWTWALPLRTRRACAALGRPLAVRRCWRALTEPAGAWCAHALALWLWHLPVLFVAALAHEPLHVLQHVSFFASALAFWWAALARPARRPGASAMVLLFTTMLHTGALGALLTFAPTPWYGTADGAGVLGLTALEEQQLGGLVMWLPGSLAYLVAGLAIAHAWLAPRRLQILPRPVQGLRDRRSRGSASP
jgi:putative membrane protein